MEQLKNDASKTDNQKLVEFASHIDEFHQLFPPIIDAATINEPPNANIYNANPQLQIINIQ